MDPLTIIVAALSAGATAAAKDTASQAVKDAYAGLKSIIQKRFADKSKPELVLKQHEADPKTWEKPLRKTLEDAKTDQDPQVLESAQKLLELVHPEQHAQGQFNVQTTGTVQGQQIGNFGTQSNVFGK